ncbi:MAG: two-component system response regulator CreB [Wohlfahrtiimonas sp.]
MTKILVVEDEKSIADTILFALQQEGFECDWVTLGTKALEQQQNNAYDFWVLDVGLPDLNGFEVCKQLRKFSEIPVIFLTARDNEIDRIVGLEIGADDYIGKPFSPRELVARVKVILKRVQPTDNKTILEEPSLSTGFSIDEACFAITYDNERLSLTRHEYQILSHLLNHPKQILSRDQLLNAVGVSADASYERTIDTHIKSIRAKLRDIDPELDVIKTHRGFGYSFELDN